MTEGNWPKVGGNSTMGRACRQATGRGWGVEGVESMNDPSGSRSYP